MKIVPSTGDTPIPTFLPLLECFLEYTFFDGAHFFYRIFLNLRVFKKKESDELLVHMLSSADVARRLMLIAKRGKWQFVVKNCR